MNHADTVAVTAARTAAEAVRHLNHATNTDHGYTWASDVDAVVAELHLTAARMDQALTQAHAWLERSHSTGRLGHDQPVEDIAAELNRAGRYFSTAGSTARDLAGTLDRLRQITAHLTTIPAGSLR